MQAVMLSGGIGIAPLKAGMQARQPRSQPFHPELDQRHRRQVLHLGMSIRGIQGIYSAYPGGCSSVRLNTGSNREVE